MVGSGDHEEFDFLNEDTSKLTLAELRGCPDCVKLLNLSGRIGFMSEDGSCAMKFASPAAVVGKTWWELWPETERPKLIAAFQTARSGEQTSFTGRCPQADGTMRDWDVRMGPIKDDNGIVRSILVISRDATGAQASADQ